MKMQNMDEYRSEVAGLKTELGYGVLHPEGKSKEDLVLEVLRMARAGRGAPRKVKASDGPQFNTRDPLADVLLSVLHR